MRLTQIFKHYNAPHQIAAIQMLEDAIPEELLDRNADWIQCFIAEPPTKEPLIMVEKAQVDFGREIKEIKNRRR